MLADVVSASESLLVLLFIDPFVKLLVIYFALVRTCNSRVMSLFVCWKFLVVLKFVFIYGECN